DDSSSSDRSNSYTKEVESGDENPRRRSSPPHPSEPSHPCLSPSLSKPDKNTEDEASCASLVEEVKRLTASQESRRGQVRRVSVELRAAQQRLKQLNATIR
ncbi:hypothetical protein OTU49_012778, partial [Cherax quadricarinatus]